jgi:hypothetical protein
MPPFVICDCAPGCKEGDNGNCYSHYQHGPVCTAGKLFVQCLTVVVTTSAKRLPNVGPNCLFDVEPMLWQPKAKRPRVVDPIIDEVDEGIHQCDYKRAICM